VSCVTAQVPDVVMLGDRAFSVTAVDGGPLFEPEDQNLQPQPTGTACYRGHVATYAVVGEGLILVALEVGSAQRPPTLDGVEPTFDSFGFVWRYAAVALPIDFTGRLLVGDGDVPGSPYLNMGFWPAWMYADVYELGFVRGALTERRDRSAELALVRERDALAASRPAPGETTSDWISRTFSLTFDYSWPSADLASP
jgi:hypothetical protein